MTSGSGARKEVTDTGSALFDQLVGELYAAVISDVLDSLGYREQAMTADIRPAWVGARLVGRAHTVLSSDTYQLPAGDPYGMEIAAIDSTPPNAVVVGATNKSTRTCLWGELLSTATRARGGRGAGAARCSTATPGTWRSSSGWGSRSLARGCGPSIRWGAARSSRTASR